MSQCDSESEFQPKILIENAMLEESTVLQKLLGSMEGEVKDMKTQLAALKKERINIFSEPHETNLDVDLFVRDIDRYHLHKVTGCQNQNCAVLETKIAELRKDLIDAKSTADEERYLREQYDMKYKELEKKLQKMYGMKDVEEFEAASNRYQEENFELEKKSNEMKAVIAQLKSEIAEKTDLYNEYKTKYVDAQAALEESRSRMQEIDIDRKKSAVEVDIEIQNLKTKFNKQLAELTMLPEVLEGTAQQMEELKELYRQEQQKSAELEQEIEELKTKLQAATSSIETERISRQHLADINVQLYKSMKDCWAEEEKCKKKIKQYEEKIKDLEVEVTKQDEKYRTRNEEYVKLQNDMKEMEGSFNKLMCAESSKCEAAKNSMEGHIKRLEQKLIETHTLCLTYKKERDEVRHKMQHYVNALQNNYDFADIKLKQIQIQIAALKIFFGENEEEN